MNLNELKDRAYKIAKSHGWHDKKLSDETYLMLIITEIAEAVQADRDNRHADIEAFKKYEDRIDFKENFERQIKNTVEDELADVVIRSLSFAGHRGWDLQDIPDNAYDTSTTEKYIGDLTFAEIAFGICGNIFLAGNGWKTVKGVLWTTIAYCHWRGIDLWWHVEQKMRYNELRPYRHGGKTY